MTTKDVTPAGSHDRSAAPLALVAGQQSSKGISPANDAAAVEPVEALLSIAKLLGRREGARLVALNDNRSA